MTLVQGDFDKGSKTTAKNVEVTVSVYDEDGKRLEVSLFSESWLWGFKFSYVNVHLGSAAGTEVFLGGCVSYVGICAGAHLPFPACHCVLGIQVISLSQEIPLGFDHISCSDL